MYENRSPVAGPLTTRLRRSSRRGVRLRSCGERDRQQRGAGPFRVDDEAEWIGLGVEFAQGLDGARAALLQRCARRITREAEIGDVESEGGIAAALELVHRAGEVAIGP